MAKVTGHVEKRGQHGWTSAVLDFGEDGSGKRTRKRIALAPPAGATYLTKADALTQLVDMVRDITHGDYVSPSHLTVSGYLGRWLESRKGSLAPLTMQNYTTVFARHVIPTLGQTPLQEVSGMGLQAVYTSLLEGGLAGSTIRLTHSILHAALSDAVAWRLLSRNPADAAKPPKSRRSPGRVLSLEEADRLLGALQGQPDFALVYVALFSGLRRGELLALRWGDLSFQEGTLAVTRGLVWTKDGALFGELKTPRSRRVVPVGASVLAVLKSHRKTQLEQRLRAGAGWHDNDLVFPTAQGGPQRPGTVSSRFGQLMKRVGFLGLRFHGLRHSHASLLLGEGADLKTIQVRLGHESISITADCYLGCVPAGLQEEAVRRLDSEFRHQLGTRLQ